jgi:hypothetical protein
LGFDFSYVLFQREYEEFKIRINALVAKAQKVPEEGWTMADGTAWPGNNTRDHPGMIQVHLTSHGAISLKFGCILGLTDKTCLM